MVKRRIARQELVYQDSQRPPVHGRRVALVLNDLGRKVLWRATEGVGLDRVLIVLVPQPLGKPKVDQLDMSVCVQQQVFGLHIPVRDSALFLVQVLEHEHDLGRIEARHLLIEPSVFAQVCKQLAARNVIEQEVEEVAIGKGGLETGDERVARYILEDLSLVPDMVDLF